jgi:hypothetical protein
LAEINEVAATSGDDLCALFVAFPVPFASREDPVE